MTDYNRGTNQPPISQGEDFEIPQLHEMTVIKSYDMGIYAQVSRKKLPFIRLKIKLRSSVDDPETISHNNVGIFEQGFLDAIHGDIIFSGDNIFCDIYGHRESVQNFVNWLQLAVKAQYIAYREILYINFDQADFRIIQLKN